MLNVHLKKLKPVVSDVCKHGDRPAVHLILGIYEENKCTDDEFKQYVKLGSLFLSAFWRSFSCWSILNSVVQTMLSTEYNYILRGHIMFAWLYQCSPSAHIKGRAITS